MQVFVYGTLTDSDRVAEVVDDWRFVGDAILDGMHRVEGEYPSLAPGGTVEGRVLETTDIDRLDAYEGVDRGLYVRVPVPVADDAPFGVVDADRDSTAGASDRRTVDVYAGDPAALNVDADVSWAAAAQGLDATEPASDGRQRAAEPRPSDEIETAPFKRRVRAVAAECVVRDRP